jgi:prepilin peptidase CpaA
MLACQVGALLFAALSDLSVRAIPNSASALLAAAGLVRSVHFGVPFVAQTCGVALVLLLLLLPLHVRGIVGGGDVKLLVAASLGRPMMGTLWLIEATALAGGLLALIALCMRRLPRPALAPAGSSSLRRVYAAERWRNLRGAPLAYGVAIACGAVMSA